MRTLSSVLLLIVFIFFSSNGHTYETISVSEIKPGMKGYGLTVFQGTEPERFEVEVISIVPNFLLKQDVILIRCKHPVTDNAGVIGGMSGSPIFIEGRLAGALAYGWQFNKEPMAGVTPIANMLAVLKRKPRSDTNFLRRRPMLLGNTAQAKTPAPPKDSFFSRFSTNTEGIVPARTPLSLGGFSQSAQKLLGGVLETFGFEPMMGGGTASEPHGPSTFQNGSAIGVQLIRGDMSATAIGTVTLVDGKNVLAFGHPMFNLGEGYFPVTTAEIHTVIASLARSNKLGSPLRTVGSLVQDRTACIAARTDKTAETVPVNIVVSDPRAGRTDRYRAEVISHRLLTPRFMQTVLANVIDDAASDVADVTAEMSGTVKLSGRPPITVQDSGASRLGAAGIAPYFRPVVLVGAVMDNPFEEIAVESVDLKINLRYGLEAALVTGAYITAENPHPGDTVNVYVRLMKYGDKEQLITVPVTVPLHAAGKTLDVEVGGGEFIQPVMPEPRNLDDALANVKRLYPPKSLVVKLDTEDPGVTMEGRVLDRLPPSVVNTLRPSTGFDRFNQYKTELVRVTETPYLIEGRQSFKFTVADRRPE